MEGPLPRGREAKKAGARRGRSCAPRDAPFHSRCRPKAFPVFPAAQQALTWGRSSLPARVRLRERQPPFLSPASSSPAGCHPVSNTRSDTSTIRQGLLTPSGTEAPWEDAGHVGQSRALLAEARWHVLCTPPHSIPTPGCSPKLRRPLPFASGPTSTAKSALRSSSRGQHGKKTGSGWGGRGPSALPRYTPLTSVCPDVGLETVVIFVLLATDSTLIGPWKTGKEETGQPASNAYNQEAPGPSVTTSGNSRWAQWGVTLQPHRL